MTRAGLKTVAQKINANASDSTTLQPMKKYLIIGLVIALIGVGKLALSFAPVFLLHLFVHSKTEAVHSSKDNQNTLLELKHQKSVSFINPQLAFKIHRRSFLTWNWFANWKSAGIGNSWTSGDRTIEFSNNGGDALAYSIPIRWQEDESAGPVVSQITTNVSPALRDRNVFHLATRIPTA